MIPCALVHDTGTMIRFRTSRLGDLPAASGDVALLLPTGRVVTGYFNRNPRNPNVSGEELVRYVKRRLRFGEREDVLVERRNAGLWALHLVEPAVAAAKDTELSPAGINGRTLRLLRGVQSVRRQAYVEFDLPGMLEEQRFEDFEALYRLLHRTR